MAGEKRAEQRIYRTGDGELVREGDPHAVSLAYPVGEPIKPSDVDEYERLVAGEDGEPVEPRPMRVRLATAIVEAQRVLESNPGEATAEAAAQQLYDATLNHIEMRVREASDTGPLPEVPAEMYPPGAELLPAVPVAAEPPDGKDDKVVESDVAGDQGDAQPAAKGARRAANKSAAKPADKAASAPADK